MRPRGGRVVAVLAPHGYPTPGEYATPYGSRVRGVAHDLKSAGPASVSAAASQMFHFVPHGSTLVPIPDHRGSTRANLALAHAIAAASGSAVADGLHRAPGDSQHGRSLAGAARLSADEIRMSWEGGPLRDPVFLIDNVVASGATAEAAARAIGRPVVVLAWADGSAPRRAPNPPGGPLAGWPVRRLAVGDELFHGRRDAGPGYSPKWPTFFSSRAAARRWAEERGEAGGSVYRFVAKDRASLLDLADYSDLTRVAEAIDERLGTSLASEDSFDPRDIAVAACSLGIDGWWIERADMGGPDVVVCRPAELLGRGRRVARGRRGNPPEAGALPARHGPTQRFIDAVESLLAADDGRRDIPRAASEALAAAAFDLDGGPAGQGKDRSAYSVGDGYVVKVARHARGEAANIDEAARWSSAGPAERPWLVPTLAAHGGGLWLVARRAGGPPGEAWLREFERWSETGRSRVRMPPRALVDAVEHGWDASDWLTYRGHPAMHDYA